VVSGRFDFVSNFYGRSVPNAQPNPYCMDDGGMNYGLPLYICYTPQDLKVAYNFPGDLDGSGQTIVIIDAWGSPTVQSDLKTFDRTFHLPPTTIQIVCQGGVCPIVNLSDPSQLASTQEIALDTQYTHAMAPGAHIVLFLARSDDDLTLEQAALAAITMFPHSVISQSFGDPELDMLEGTCFLLSDTPNRVCSPAYVHRTLATGEAAYELAAREGTTVFAGAGDWGADNSGLCAELPSPCGLTSANAVYPASSPWVTSVGGTMGDPYYLGSIPSCGHSRTCSTGLVAFDNTPSCQLNTMTPTAAARCVPVGYGGEQVWNEPSFFGPEATGGAPSLIFGAPAYQRDLGLTARTTPDVSFDAGADGGVIIYWSALPSYAGFWIQGGTSLGSPQWAAIVALADQLASIDHRGTIGFINPALYEIGNCPWLYQRDFHDVTVGNNTIAGSPDNIGFNATPGWDDATGWGTPNVANLVPDLVALSGAR
jgi:subtilase family serine protease